MSEPWRYRCPACGSTGVRVRNGGLNRSSGGRSFYCAACHERPDALLDVKTDELTRPKRGEIA